MKEYILKYIELNPSLTYNDLYQIFGLPMKDLLKLLDINNFKIKKTLITNGEHLISGFEIGVLDTNDNCIYKEYPRGYWNKIEYGTNGNETYEEDSRGHWYKNEYDKNGNKTYHENFDGYWVKRKYNTNNNKIYEEDSDGIINKWFYNKEIHKITYDINDSSFKKNLINFFHFMYAWFIC